MYIRLSIRGHLVWAATCTTIPMHVLMHGGGGGGGLWDGISKCNIIVKSLLNNDCILLYIINIIYCYIRAPANTTLINISSYLIVRPIMKALRSA